MGNFETVFAYLFDIEGGYVDDPRDPGGKTNYGITDATLQRAISLGIVPEGVTIHTLTADQSKTIYRELYWKPCRCDELPMPLSVFVFDAAVNQGEDAAIRMLQKVLNVRIDGKLGKLTMDAARNYGNSAETMALYLADRALRYTGTRNFDRFGRGWFKRLFRLSMSRI